MPFIYIFTFVSYPFNLHDKLSMLFPVGSQTMSAASSELEHDAISCSSPQTPSRHT